MSSICIDGTGGGAGTLVPEAGSLLDVDGRIGAGPFPGILLPGFRNFFSVVVDPVFSSRIMLSELGEETIDFIEVRVVVDGGSGVVVEGREEARLIEGRDEARLIEGRDDVMFIEGRDDAMLIGGGIDDGVEAVKEGGIEAEAAEGIEVEAV